MPADHDELRMKLREMSLYELQNELMETDSEQEVDLILEEIRGRKRKEIVEESQKDKIPNYCKQVKEALSKIPVPVTSPFSLLLRFEGGVLINLNETCAEWDPVMNMKFFHRKGKQITVEKDGKQQTFLSKIEAARRLLGVNQCLGREKLEARLRKKGYEIIQHEP